MSFVGSNAFLVVQPRESVYAAGDQLSVHHGDPHWDPRSGRVLATRVDD